MIKLKVKGIILRICCFKYKETRNKYNLKNRRYNGYQYINLYGDINLNKNYTFIDNTLTIKCEDDYLFLYKKTVKSFEILLNLFEIDEGILISGDDILFNIENLNKFLDLNNKNDYMGKNFFKKKY